MIRHAHPRRQDELRLLAGLLWFALTILIVVLLSSPDPRPRLDDSTAVLGGGARGDARAETGVPVPAAHQSAGRATG